MPISNPPVTVSKIESLLWEEVCRRHRTVCALSESDPTRPVLEGSVLQTRLKIADGHFAMGLSTDEPVRFQGFHAENLLVVLDEACGVPEEIWDAVEGVCVGRNNRVLAISNPLAPTGRFFSLFKSPRWKTVTISALDHPNVLKPEGRLIPGAVTSEAVEDRIADWCERFDAEPKEDEGAGTAEEAQDVAVGDTFVWRGQTYLPNPMFCSRVLGAFPQSGEDTLYKLAWIEKAMQEKDEGRRMKDEASAANCSLQPGISGTDEGFSSFIPHPSSLPCVLAVDVARFGGDETVLALRRGDRIEHIWTYRGLDTVAVARKVVEKVRETEATVIAVDEIGIGAGVVDQLRAARMAGLLPINWGGSPMRTRQKEPCLNLRAQTFWLLRDRFRTGAIGLPHDEILSAQLLNLHYEYSQTGLIQIESKDSMRRRGLPSPDRADAVALAFSPMIRDGGSIVGGMRTTSQNGLERERQRERSRHDTDRAVAPTRWLDVSRW